MPVKIILMLAMLLLLSCKPDISKHNIKEKTVKFVHGECKFKTQIQILSCKPDIPKYGIEFNDERKEIGLPIINHDWKYATGESQNNNWWINQAKEKDKAYHFSKWLAYKSDTIIIDSILEETNYYMGPKETEYTTVDGTFREELFITYKFADKQWKYSLTTSSYNQFDLTKREADSILKVWKIE